MGLLKKIMRRDCDKGRCFCSAVVPAAGSSSRMGGENKMFAEICGIPVLARTLISLENSDDINEIIVVTRSEDIERVAKLCREYNIGKASQVVCGGSTRAESVYHGVEAVSENADIIAVHDGARPFITEDVIRGAVDGAVKYHAAAPAVPVKDTVKIVENGFVKTTLDRSRIMAIQTPQVFDAALLKAALQNVIEKKLEITDDCMAVEALGARVFLSKGSYDNIKITTPEDIAASKAIVEKRDGAQ